MKYPSELSNVYLIQSFLCRWFHPHVTVRQAEDILLNEGLDGNFMVVPSQIKPGDFNISVRCVRAWIYQVTVSMNTACSFWFEQYRMTLGHVQLGGWLLFCFKCTLDTFDYCITCGNLG